MASYSVGGRTYPMVTIPQCNTCSSPHRMEIEKRILAGTPYRRISEWTEETFGEGRRVSAQSIRGHFDRGHIPVEAEVVRRVLDRQAADRGEDLETMVTPIVSGVEFAEVVLQKTVQRISSGEIQPSVVDGLNAARIMEQFREFEAANSEEVWVQAFIRYHEAAKRIMTPAQFERFGHELSSDEVLHALAEGAASEGSEGRAPSSFYDMPGGEVHEAIPGETVED